MRNSLGNVRLQYKMFTKNRISVVSGWKLVTQLNTSAVLNPDLTLSEDTQETLKLNVVFVHDITIRQQVFLEVFSFQNRI